MKIFHSVIPFENKRLLTQIAILQIHFASKNIDIWIAIKKTSEKLMRNEFLFLLLLFRENSDKEKRFIDGSNLIYCWCFLIFTQLIEDLILLKLFWNNFLQIFEGFWTVGRNFVMNWRLNEIERGFDSIIKNFEAHKTLCIPSFKNQDVKMMFCKSVSRTQMILGYHRKFSIRKNPWRPQKKLFYPCQTINNFFSFSTF